MFYCVALERRGNTVQTETKGHFLLKGLNYAFVDQRRCLWKPPVPQGHFLRVPFEKSWAKTLIVLFQAFYEIFKFAHL